MYRLNQKDIKTFTAISVLLLLCACGCHTRSDQNTQEEHRSQQAFSDQPISDYQVKLLQQAFDTATAIPVYPHLKTRSRKQADVVAACLQLDQPVLAQRYCEKIDSENWRRGLAYGELADYCAEHGYPDQALLSLDRVQDVIHTLEEDLQPDEVSWRRDSLKSMIARTRYKLKKNKQTLKQEHDTSLFEQQRKALDESLKVEGFEGIKSALYLYTELYDRHYEDTERRILIENKITTSWQKMPVFVRLELLAALAQTALNHSDAETSLHLVNDAQVFLDDYEWNMEEYLPRAALIAKLRFQAGDMEKAKADIDALNSLFDEKGSEIMGIFRADVLLALAETYASMNNIPAALSVYKKAVKEGGNNQNARPRAEDLSSVCCSIAENGIEPDEALWVQIRTIHEGLGDPW